MNKIVRFALLVTVVTLFMPNAGLFASETDDRIESSAKKSYVFETYLKGDDVNVQSRNGVVVLSGTVSEESHKSLAWETVASLPGVKSVDMKLAVKEKTPDPHSDAWLITKVKSTLLFHRNVNASATEVFAKDGTITLRGKATSAAQRDLTTEYAKDVEGVKTVKNEMTVLPATEKPAEIIMDENEKMDTMGESIDDASITALVKTTLQYHRSTSALHPTVVTKDGVVKLEGKAKNAAEKDLATKLVSDVHGVKKVVNNMTVL